VACGYRYLFTSEALEELTSLLLARCGPQFAHIVYSSSGSEAVESAMKLALQYWDARGLPKKRFVARERSYHGNTLGALSASGYLERRRPFEGSLLDVSFVSAANTYRPLRGAPAAELVAALADELDARIKALAQSMSRRSFSSRSSGRRAVSCRLLPDTRRQCAPFVTGTTCS